MTEKNENILKAFYEALTGDENERYPLYATLFLLFAAIIIYGMYMIGIMMILWGITSIVFSIDMNEFVFIRLIILVPIALIITFRPRE